jgi:hypothetical protein
MILQEDNLMDSPKKLSEDLLQRYLTGMSSRASRVSSRLPGKSSRLSFRGFPRGYSGVSSGVLQWCHGP